jgi:hypothetical protein
MQSVCRRRLDEQQSHSNRERDSEVNQPGTPISTADAEGVHLYQIFPKLGITSRAALRDALGESVRNQPGADQGIDT